MPLNTDGDCIDVLVGAIYDAALRPALWPDVVARIVGRLGGSAGLLFTPLDPTGSNGFVASFQLSAHTLSQYAEHFHQLDIWTQAGATLGRFKTGEVVSDEELVPRAALLESSYFKGFLQPAGISRLCTAAIFGTENANLPATVLSVYGGLQAPVFDSVAKETMRLLVPHLSRALGVMYQLRVAESRAAASLAALDQIERGIVLLGAEGQVIHANRRAREMVSATSVLEVVNLDGLRRLVAREPRSDLALRQWLSGTLQGTVVPAEHFTNGMLLLCGKGSPLLYLTASRLSDENAYRTHEGVPVAIVFVEELESVPCIDLEALRALYCLTPSELRLVEGLAHGHTLSQMAAMQQLSVHTMRDRLKQVFKKTGVRRQVEVMKLALSLGK